MSEYNLRQRYVIHLHRKKFRKLYQKIGKSEILQQRMPKRRNRRPLRNLSQRYRRHQRNQSSFSPSKRLHKRKRKRSTADQRGFPLGQCDKKSFRKKRKSRLPTRQTRYSR